MSQGAFVTLVGFVAQDPNIRSTPNGKLLTKVRVGTTPRYHDNASGEWRDAETSYFTVTCWSKLAEHARLSLRKGDPVIVKGRFSANNYEDKNGQPRSSIEITADTLGHDLSRGPANYIRLRSPQARTEDDPARDAAAEGCDLPGGSGEMIDEEAIERFGRDLDKADLAARALGDDEDGAAGDEVPPVPAAPF
jgi:single-strand DNA-binding protein